MRRDWREHKENEVMDLLCDGDVPVRKRIGAEHACLDVLVLVHLQILREYDAGSLPVVNLFELGAHLEKVEVRAVTSIKPRRY